MPRLDPVIKTTGVLCSCAFTRCGINGVKPSAAPAMTPPENVRRESFRRDYHGDSSPVCLMNVPVSSMS